MGGRIMASTINADTSNGVIITPDTSGEIELQANGVTKAKITANGLQDNNGNSLRGGSYRNLLINGDMKIAQRGTSATNKTAQGYYTVDRFQIINNTTTGAIDMTQSTTVPSGQGFSNSIQIDTATAKATLSGTNEFGIQQRIEGQNLQHLKYGTSNAEKLTMSFWVKSNKTGTYVIWFYRTGTTRHIQKQYTISSADTWEKKTLTIDGDTTGAIANNNSNEFEFLFCLGTGPDRSSGTAPTTWQTINNADRYVGQTVNILDSTSNYFNLTGVQLEVGEGASDFEHLPYDVQLRRCQRYYEVLYGQAATGYGILSYPLTGNVNSSWCTWFFKQQKRALPTFNLASGASWQNATPAVYVALDNVGFVNNTTFFYSGGSANTPNLTASAEL
jgi:hypothetical protein